MLGSGTAYAANGGSFRLGQSNSASQTSSLDNPQGTALVLRSKSGAPSLKVNRTTKVPNLNADLLDGLSSSRLARVVQVGSVSSSGFVFDNDTSDTSDDAIVAVAQCPGTSQLMGGGAQDLTDGVTYVNGPDIAGGTEAWVMITDADPATNDADDRIATAQCWNPLADVGDVEVATAPKTISQSIKRLALKVAARR